MFKGPHAVRVSHDGTIEWRELYIDAVKTYDPLRSLNLLFQFSGCDVANKIWTRLFRLIISAPNIEIPGKDYLLLTGLSDSPDKISRAFNTLSLLMQLERTLKIYERPACTAKCD